MSIKFAVITRDPQECDKVHFDEFEEVETLGESRSAIALEIDEVVKSISNTVQKSVSSESELVVEISGSISIQANAGVKWVLFNAGGKAMESNTLKITLKTKINPE